MKKFSKIMALLLAMVMVLGLTVSAMAAEGDKNDSITVNNAKAGETYDLYKLFDLKVNDETNPTAYSYTINEGWTAFFTGTGAGAAYITVNEQGYVTAISDAAALAKAAAAWANKPAATKSVTVAEGETTAVFSDLPDGYWLITSTLGTLAMTETTPDASAVTVNEKNPEDTITKEVQEDSSSAWGEENDAQIGDTVNFRSTVKIVKGTRNVVVHDKMTSGLTFTAGSIAIEGLTAGTEYTVNESPADGDTFDITFDQEWIDGLDFGNDGYKEYVITYTAVLNENAVVKGDDGVAIVDQNNKTKVSFGDGTSSTEDSTTTETHKFSVYKHATGSTDNLADAVFSLKKGGTVVKLIKLDDNNYRVANGEEAGAVETFITVASGDIVIWGVDADDDYTLEEITPPDGYNKLEGEKDVTVDAGNGTRIDVENKAGSELPSTGGIGTTIFYIVGAILVLGAGIALITKKRMSSM
ncbi:MAG: isopeptide-forming domain-containing fimbrial protein [Lachnospiraceae bacterium]|nr:isopeptide-forming domain-containing fimbrial protein [Lachnospiraceae bacterium]